MKQPGYNDVVIVYREVDRVGKSSEQATSEFIVNSLIKERMARDITCAGIEHPKEFVTKTRGFCFVPGKAADCIIFDFR